MAFDFSTLITDRTLADVQQGTDKGFYNASDLNRVDAALEDLAARFRGYGYAVPGYQRIKINHAATGRLPDGYTELEYIQSSGTQWINTGFTPKSTTRIKMSVKFLGGTTTSALFGARGSSSGTDTKSFTFFLVSQKPRSDYFGKSLSFTQTFPTSQAEIDWDKNVCTLDSETVTHTQTSATSNQSLYLFAVDTAGSATLPATMQLYNCEVYDNGTLVRNFVPCKNSSRTVGLYDTVGEQFYSNAGTWTFTAGAEVPIIDNSKDPYIWYEDDVPTASQMTQYLTNVSAIKKRIKTMKTTPATPGGMALLNYLKANNIEKILADIDFILQNMPAAFRHSGVTICGSKGVIA